MNRFTNGLAALAGATALFAAPAASAAVIGVTVDPSDNSVVGETEFRPALGDEAVRYFIPLNGNSADGIYGVDDGGQYGLTSDSGSGGPTLSMYLLFEGLNAGGAYTLDILFEDLDLAGANDPNGFFETLEVLSADGMTSFSGLITNITDPLVSGDAGTQQLLSLFLGTIASESFLIRLDFTADFSGKGSNTAEFLIAEVSEVPLPAAAWLFLAGVAGFGFAGRGKKKAQGQAA